MNRNPWDYMLSIERDFIRTLDYVELNERHQEVYSNEYAKLLLLAGSEAETVLAKTATESAGRGIAGIKECQAVLLSEYPNFPAADVHIPKYSMTLWPFAAWAKKRTAPDWWIAYNQVKHDRLENFAVANQLNALNAVAGLLVANCFLVKGRHERHTSLMDVGHPGILIAEARLTLPGLETTE